MAQIVKLKRSAVAGKLPTISSLELGEIAINTKKTKCMIFNKTGRLIGRNFWFGKKRSKWSENTNT